MSSPFAICPGLFQPAIAQDGILTRIRIPGGQLTVLQCEAIAQAADQIGDGRIQITNRANVQIRGLQAGIDPQTLYRFQTLGLAAPIAAVDAIRNIMASPTAGIDRQQLLDTRPLVAAWNRYLMSKPDLATLSPKFSVCFDGGEAVAVRDRPNDISLVAVPTAAGVKFRLRLSLGDRGAAPADVGVLIHPDTSLQVLAVLTDIYRDYVTQSDSQKARKPRLRELLHTRGVETYLQTAAPHLPFPLERCDVTVDGSSPDTYHHLGVHPQRQPEQYYIGVVIPLGRLTTAQWRGLAALATAQGSGTLRLTPWQTVLLTDIPAAHVVSVQREIVQLGLHWVATHPLSAIVACSGTTGCKASATDTQTHALALAAYLDQHITLDRPINIHFSGCRKSCAQYHASDITLLGMPTAQETYRIYVGDVGAKFGRELGQPCPVAQLPHVIEQIIRTYQQQRSQPDEPFKDFVNRDGLAELTHRFGISQPANWTQEDPPCQ